MWSSDTGTESIICHVFCSENMGIYDDIDADVLRNYQEFAMVNIIYFGLKESTTSEQSARMTAMDSASKNACESFYMSPSFHFQVWSLLMLSLILKNSHLQSCLFSSLHQLRWLTSWLWPSTEPARPSSLRSSLRSFLEPLLCKMFFLFLCSSFTLIITHACHLLSSSILSLGYGFLMSFSVTSTACLYFF